MEGGDEGVEMVVDSKDLQQQSKAFDKLTDRVEDRQLDSTRVQEAMASIAASSEADWNAMRLSWTKRWLKEPCVSIKVMQLLPLDTYFTRVKVRVFATMHTHLCILNYFCFSLWIFDIFFKMS
ncbi:PREDICTED: uncharacterized protein LOC109329073 isoform X1 [Lupinus angustifolius]|uniref:uncharacterized protein LOC109329073 isoform X1 n=1 Tax=Lupinus angustifolius TaxID=3871 RepID=UPI00092EE015|nr:PREDICTED: uncharacterized protein LOC109329073 isoform X1 [Lupinus angustifolius]